jgi:hypothetical protein
LPETDVGEIRIDHGVGPFTLGEQASTVRALLAQTPRGTADGLDVYKPEGVSGGVSCGGGPLERSVVAVRFNSEGTLVTVIENLRDLHLEGSTGPLQALVRTCEDEQEGLPQPEGPLTSWLPVTCGARQALADHPLSNGSTAQDTTLIIPEAEPLVIVTSDPTSACEDAARLHAEWSA